VQPLVLAYHGFGDRTAADDPYNMFVPLDAFADQLDHLLAKGWTPLDLNSYIASLESWPTPRRSFLITIDDGYLSTLDAGEVLTTRGIRALVFVPAGLLGSSSATWAPDMSAEPLLDADGLRAAVDLGFDVGVHGWDHTSLVRMSPGDLRRNTVDAKEAIGELTGVRPRSFAYPGGHFDGTATQAVQGAGYTVAFSVDKSAGRFAVPRIDVNATDTLRTFAMKCSRWWPAARVVGRRFPRVRRGIHSRVGSAR
jgi:peptidoglycan/xylan/chitin deacetylase (PgdA/CDA1 family)